MITERGNRRRCRRCCRLRWQIAPAECQREEGEEGRRPPRSERASAVSSARVDLIASNRRKGFNLVESRRGGSWRRDPRSGSCRRRRCSIVIYPFATFSATREIIMPRMSDMRQWRRRETCFMLCNCTIHQANCPFYSDNAKD